MKRNEINKELEQLVNMDPDKVEAPALKAALELHRKQVAEKEAELALERIGELDRIVNRQVVQLRSIRQQERQAKDKLTKLMEARAQFFKDGNWAAFVKVYHNY